MKLLVCTLCDAWWLGACFAMTDVLCGRGVERVAVGLRGGLRRAVR